MNLIIGSHVSFNNKKQLLGSVEEAISYNANTFMIYTGGAQSTMRSVINDELTYEGYKLMLENNINANAKPKLPRKLSGVFYSCGQTLSYMMVRDFFETAIFAQHRKSRIVCANNKK